MEQLENIPGYDIAMDKYNEYGEEHFNRINPFEDEDGNTRKLSGNPQQQKSWRRIQKQAWVHDKCFLGLCGVGMDCGLGLVPLAVFFLPAIGPIVMYAVHARLIHIAQEELFIPEKLVMRLQSNILLDFLISLPPGIGAFFSWMYGSLTRNAGLIYLYMEKTLKKQAAGEAPVYMGPKRDHVMLPQQANPTASSRASPTGYKSSNPASRMGHKSSKQAKKGGFLVGEQQSGVR